MWCIFFGIFFSVTMLACRISHWYSDLNRLTKSIWLIQKIYLHKKSFFFKMLWSELLVTNHLNRKGLYKSTHSQINKHLKLTVKSASHDGCNMVRFALWLHSSAHSSALCSTSISVQLSLFMYSEPLDVLGRWRNDVSVSNNDTSVSHTHVSPKEPLSLSVHTHTHQSQSWMYYAWTWCHCVAHICITSFTFIHVSGIFFFLP